MKNLDFFEKKVLTKGEMSGILAERFEIEKAEIDN